MSQNKTLKAFGPALRWMYFEAEAQKLRLRKGPRIWKKASAKSKRSSLWSILSLKNKTTGIEKLELDTESLHKSLKGIWRIFEVLPFKQPKFGELEQSTWW